MTMLWRLCAILLAFGCVSSPAAARELPAVAAALDCESLAGRRFTAEGVPVRLATAKLNAERAEAPFCQVTGYVAPQVRFELRLPTSGWQQRLLFTGCGGLCGMIGFRTPAAEGCAPLGRGEFAMVASDLGHSARYDDALWASGNPQGIADFGHRGVHLVTQAAHAIISSYYGQAPRYSYFVGCSDGGREGLMAAQRYPGDFDGIVAGAPVINQTGNNSVFHAWAVQHLLTRDSKPVLGEPELALLAGEVLRQCDGLDRARDGLVADFQRCRPTLKRIACTARSEGPCLNDAQQAAVLAMYAGPTSPDGRALYFGYPPGSELSWNQQVRGALNFARSFVSYMTGRIEPEEVDVWSLAFDAATVERYNTNAAQLNALDPDLTRFAGRGGKLLMWHGAADASVPPGSSAAYFAAVRAAMGAGADSFLRLYMLPGVGHCGGGKGPDKIDLLTPAMAWVEDGLAPTAITATARSDPQRQMVLAPFGP